MPYGYLLANTTDRLLINTSNDILLGVWGAGEVYRLYTEADYDATTKTTGSGQEQGWDVASRLGGGGSGDVKFTINNTNSVYVTISGLDFEFGQGAWRWHVSTSGLSMTNGDTFQSAAFLTSSNVPVWILIHEKTGGGQFRFVLEAYDNGSVLNDTIVSDQSNAPHYIDIVATRGGASDGSLSLFVDGLLAGSITDLTSDALFTTTNKLSIGAFSGLDAGTSGSLYVGKVLMRDNATLIGPYVSSNSLTYLRRRRRD